MASSTFEKIDYTKFGPAPVAGVDEVGRGCLAGPVYAAAVCLKSSEHLELMSDSKLVSESRREKIAPLIIRAHWVGIGSATVEEIDELNILQASLLAMHRAILELEKQMGCPVGHVLVDGNQRIPDLRHAKQTTITKGDLRCAPISAASIVAKVARDNLLRELHTQHPAYDFAKNKGYGSEFHRKAIADKGPTTWHRKSFSGVKEFL